MGERIGQTVEGSAKWLFLLPDNILYLALR